MRSEGLDRWEDWFQPGETLLWEGAPVPGVRNFFQNAFFTVFGIPFLGAGIFVSGLGLGYFFGFVPDWNIWHIAIGIFLTAFGVPFIGAGGAMVFGPWVHDFLRPRRIRYALTDRNGYVASRLWKRTMEVLPLRADTRLETEEHRDGTMTIWFFFESSLDSDGDRQTTKKGFEALRDGHEVFTMLRGLLSAMKGETT